MHPRAAFPDLWPGPPVRGSTAVLQSSVDNDRYIGCPGGNDIHTYIHFPSGVVHNVNIPSSCASALARRQVLSWMPSFHNGPNSEKPPLYLLPNTTANCY